MTGSRKADALVVHGGADALRFVRSMGRDGAQSWLALLAIFTGASTVGLVRASQAGQLFDASTLLSWSGLIVSARSSDVHGCALPLTSIRWS